MAGMRSSDKPEANGHGTGPRHGMTQGLEDDTVSAVCARRRGWRGEGRGEGEKKGGRERGDSPAQPRPAMPQPPTRVTPPSTARRKVQRQPNSRAQIHRNPKRGMSREQHRLPGERSDQT